MWFNLKDGKKKLLVVGNSHSKDLYNTLTCSASASENFQIARYGTQLRSLAKLTDPFYKSPNYKNADIIMISSKYSLDDISALDDIIQKCKADNKMIVIVENIYEFGVFGTKTLADFYIQQAINSNTLSDENNVSFDQLVDKVDKAYYREYKQGDTESVNLSIEEIAANYDDVILLNRMKYICDDSSGQCFTIDNQLEKYFYDYGHHTLEGAKLYGKRVDQVDWLRNVINGEVEVNADNS